MQIVLRLLTILLLSSTLASGLHITSVTPALDFNTDAVVLVTWNFTDADPNYFILRVEWIGGALSAGVGSIATQLGQYNATFTPTIKAGDEFSIQAVPVGEAQGNRVYDSYKWLQALLAGTFVAVSPSTTVPSVSTISLGFTLATSTSKSPTSTATAAGQNRHHQLSTGSKVGIAVACVIVGFVLTAGIGLLIRRLRKTAERRKELSEKQVWSPTDADDATMKPELPGNAAREPFKKSELDGSGIAQIHKVDQEGRAELQTNINSGGRTGGMELDSRNVVEMDGNGLTELD